MARSTVLYTRSTPPNPSRIVRVFLCAQSPDYLSFHPVARADWHPDQTQPPPCFLPNAVLRPLRPRLPMPLGPSLSNQRGAGLKRFRPAQEIPHLVPNCCRSDQLRAFRYRDVVLRLLISKRETQTRTQSCGATQPGTTPGGTGDRWQCHGLFVASQPFRERYGHVDAAPHGRQPTMPTTADVLGVG